MNHKVCQISEEMNLIRNEMLRSHSLFTDDWGPHCDSLALGAGALFGSLAPSRSLC